MKTLAHVASRFLNTPLMIHPPKLEAILRALGPRLGISPDALPGRGMDATVMRYAQANVEHRPYTITDGIAIIPVEGTLLKKDSFVSAWSGSTSYQQIQAQLADAVADAGVSAILLDIDSPGGEASGCFDLADYIYSLRSRKPVWAVANDIALSSAYAIASSTSRIYLSRTGAVGSIGVYALHMDQSGFDRNLGVKYTFVFAGERKVDANQHEPLSERAETDIQDEVDREYGLFTETVARNRNTSKDAVAGTEAAVYWAENAIPLLADEVGTFDDALNDLRNMVRGSAKPLAARSAAVQNQNQKGRIIEMTTKSFQEIEREAMREAQALKFRGGSLPPLYAHGAANAPCTKEAAIARHYEANPEDYAAYRAQHNAKGLIATLEAAGIRLAAR